MNRRSVQRAQRARGTLHLRGIAGALEMEEPRQQGRKLPPRQRQRSERIREPLRHLLQRSRHRHRNDRARRDRAGVAEGCAAPWLRTVDQSDTVTVALQVERSDDADDARADDADVVRRYVETCDARATMTRVPAMRSWTQRRSARKMNNASMSPTIWMS